MKVLKFRVWYKDEKRFLETPDGLFFKYPHNEMGEYIGDFIKDPYIVTQFINVLDINGKEIYEGDIVKAGNKAGIVNFSEGAYFIDDALLFETYVLMAGNITVIGNIFEKN